MYLGQVTAGSNITGRTLVEQINMIYSISPGGCRATRMAVMPFGLMRPA